MSSQKFIHSFFLQSWWVIAFVILCGIVYERSLLKREVLFQQLYTQHLSLQKEKKRALEHQKNLQMQVNSQSDRAWIELTLMNGLGLVPEDQLKIYFENK